MRGGGTLADGRKNRGRKENERGGEGRERERTSTYVQGSAVTEFDKLLGRLERRLKVT